MEAKRSATQSRPPEIWRAIVGYEVGSKAIAKTTSTSSVKNNMPLRKSLERHSMRKSLRR
jgi:hypothetical protein